MSNQTSDNNKRIAKNTLLLYFRMLFNYGGVVVYESCDIECVGGGGLWNTFLSTVNTF